SRFFMVSSLLLCLLGDSYTTCTAGKVQDLEGNSSQSLTKFHVIPGVNEGHVIELDPSVTHQRVPRLNDQVRLKASCALRSEGTSGVHGFTTDVLHQPIDELHPQPLTTVRFTNFNITQHPGTIVMRVTNHGDGLTCADQPGAVVLTLVIIHPPIPGEHFIGIALRQSAGSVSLELHLRTFSKSNVLMLLAYTVTKPMASTVLCPLNTYKRNRCNRGIQGEGAVSLNTTPSPYDYGALQRSS